MGRGNPQEVHSICGKLTDTLYRIELTSRSNWLGRESSLGDTFGQRKINMICYFGITRHKHVDMTFYVFETGLNYQLVSLKMIHIGFCNVTGLNVKFTLLENLFKIFLKRYM